MAIDKTRKKIRKTAGNSRPGDRPRKKKHTKRNVLIGIILVLVIFRLFLPYIVLRYVNNKLENLEDYYGHVEDIDIHLYRGAYVIKDMKIVKLEKTTQKKDTIPFFKTPNIDLSVEWRAIFKGRIVGEVYIESPVLNFVKGKHKDENVKQDTADFKELVNDLMPLTVNHFEINKGQMHYIDANSQPKVDVSMKEIKIVATNISNVNDSAKLLPASIIASALAYEGKLVFNANFDGLNKYPTFDLNARFTDINLVLLNAPLQAYGNFDVKKGKIGLYTEFAAKNGEFGGYVKPLITDLDVVQWNKEEGNFKQILWETLIGSSLEVVQNQSTETLATKIPVKGKFDDPNINIWKAISYVLRNAFLQAFKPALDNTINIRQLEDDKKKTFLEKVFGDKDDSKNNKESKKEKREEGSDKRKEKD